MLLSITTRLNLLTQFLGTKNLTATQKQIFNSLICITQGESRIPIEDDQINDHIGLNLKNIRRELKKIQKEGLIEIFHEPDKDLKTNYKKRHISLSLPANIRNLLFPEYETLQDLTALYLPYPPNNQRSLTFIGTPIRESKRLCDDGSWITEVELINVYSLEGHIHFKCYWVPKSLLFKSESESESESESDKLSFKALPQVSPAEQLLLTVTQPYIGIQASTEKKYSL